MQTKTSCSGRCHRRYRAAVPGGTTGEGGMSNQPGATPPAVAQQPPPRWVLRIINPIFARLLRPPLQGAVDKAFMLVPLPGRKTGRRYSIVVGRHALDQVPTAMTGAPWRVNARGGADAEVTSGGRTWRARAELVEDPDAVAAAYAGEIDRLGWKGARRQLGLVISVGRAPTHEELLEAVRRDHLALIRFHPA